MIEALRRLYAGEFNRMVQIGQDDGTVRVLLFIDADAIPDVEMVVRDLFGPKEEVVSWREINTANLEHVEPHLKERLLTAKSLTDERNANGLDNRPIPSGDYEVALSRLLRESSTGSGIESAG